MGVYCSYMWTKVKQIQSNIFVVIVYADTRFTKLLHKKPTDCSQDETLETRLFHKDFHPSERNQRQQYQNHKNLNYFLI